MKLLEFNNILELSNWATDSILKAANIAIEQKGYFTISLCGGSSPIQIFKNLSNSKVSEQLDWNKIFIFWGDERFVEDTNKNSNYNLINTLLLSNISIPEKNIFKTPVNESSVEIAAEVYEKQIIEFFSEKNGLDKKGIPVFDIMLQGAGNDGHTASLFPGTPQLKETKKIVVNVEAPEYAPVRDRISFTFKLINNAENIILLLSGRNKGTIAGNFLSNNPKTDLPIQHLDRSNKTTVLIDRSIYLS